MIEFKLPALGENVEQGDLVRLMIAPGATVSEGQAVMELETDKAVVEVPSSVSGTIKEVLADHNGAAAATDTSRKTDAHPKSSTVAPAQSTSNKGAAAAAKSQPQSESSTAVQRSRATDIGASEFRLQELGENISEGDLVRLIIAPGAKVS